MTSPRRVLKPEARAPPGVGRKKMKIKRFPE